MEQRRPRPSLKTCKDESWDNFWSLHFLPVRTLEPPVCVVICESILVKVFIAFDVISSVELSDRVSLVLVFCGPCSQTNAPNSQANQKGFQRIILVSHKVSNCKEAVYTYCKESKHWYYKEYNLATAHSVAGEVAELKKLCHTVNYYDRGCQ